MSTSVISFPRSPQPTYTMMSAFDHLERVCCTTVFPLPNGPGTAAVPPIATGKRTSRIRWPVTNSSVGSSLRFAGRGMRTGQVCIIRSSRPPRSRATTSVTVTSPPLISTTSSSEASGGTITRCAYEYSWTSPRMSPGPTRSPCLTLGTNVHFRARSSEVTTTPREMKSPCASRILSSGRWMPS